MTIQARFNSHIGAIAPMDLLDLQRKPKITPMEQLVCQIRGLPTDLLDYLHRNNPTLGIDEALKTEHLTRWLEDVQVRYAYIAEWIGNWRFVTTAPTGEWAALLSPMATSIDRFLDVCRVVHRLSPDCQRKYPGEDGWILLALYAIAGEFLVALADSGVAKDLGLPGYPEALEIGKTQSHNEINIPMLRVLGVKPGNRCKPKAGRPRKTERKIAEERHYPPECREMGYAMLEALKLSESNFEFRRGVYKRWIDALSQEATHQERSSEFQAAIVRDGMLIIGKKGQRGLKPSKKNISN